MFVAAIAHPPVLPPIRLFPPADVETIVADEVKCNNGDCFDYTRCPITGGFPVFIYDIDDGIRANPAMFKTVEETVEYLTRESDIVRDPSKGTRCVIRTCRS